MTSTKNSYDVVVVGAGHNGLVAAAYLARAGLSVLVLERLARVGAAASAATFAGHAARAWSYDALVSSLPEALVTDLELDLRLASRPATSYAATVRDGVPRGLLLERPAGARTAESFRELAGGEAELAAWQRFEEDVRAVAEVVAPTLLGPLPSERELREQVDPTLWRDLVTTPIGTTIEARLTDDTVRGAVAADALIGTFASLHDPSLVQNRTFLHHRLGSVGGGWRVPMGGLGALTDALARSASSAGAEIVSSAGVSAVRAGEGGAEVTWHDGASSHTVAARHVLSNVAPWVLQILLGEGEDPETKPAGAQVQVDLLLDRLPRLRSGTDPQVALAGTLRVGQDHSQLRAAYDEAAAGRLPSVLPGLVTCPSLTDPSLLGDAPVGSHILSLLALQVPASLFDADPEGMRRLAVSRAIATLDEHLAEPIESCLARDAGGEPCVAATIPQDLERDLAMPGGHLFHGELEWPWAPNRARLETPAQRWGVHTHHDSVLVCGSGARRGGGVSGIGGHNAAHAVLEAR